MKSFSSMKKVVAAGLLLSLTGSGIAWATLGTKAEAANATVSQEVEAAGKTLALHHWREYMRQIGWPEDQVLVAHPGFVNTVSVAERLADGGWKLVFDGTRPGEWRMVTLQLDDRGIETGAAVVEWADLCMQSEMVEVVR